MIYVKLLASVSAFTFFLLEIITLGYHGSLAQVNNGMVLDQTSISAGAFASSLAAIVTVVVGVARDRMKVQRQLDDLSRAVIQTNYRMQELTERVSELLTRSKP